MASKRGRGFQSGHSDRLRPAYIQQKDLARIRQASETASLSLNMYKCECCLMYFPKEDEDEKVLERAKQDYPNDDMSDAVLVCGTCYEAIKARIGDMS